MGRGWNGTGRSPFIGVSSESSIDAGSLQAVWVEIGPSPLGLTFPGLTLRCAVLRPLGSVGNNKA